MFMNYRERFEYLKLSEGFEFVDYANHKIELRCKECGYTWLKYDDFIRRSKHGNVICSKCGLTCKYEAPEYEKRIPKPSYVKKGYHTQAVIEAREKQTAIKRQQGEDLYRQRFEALGIDFTYLRREWSKPKDKRFWCRCNKCGYEMIRDRGSMKNQNSIHCNACGNGTVLYSDLANEVLKYYAEGHSCADTCQRFGIKKTTLQNWAKYRHISNGRDAKEILKECNRKRSIGELPMPDAHNETVKRKAIEHQTARLKEQGFEYIEGSKTSKRFTIRCMACDCVFTRNYSSIYKPINCPECSKQKRQELRQKKTAEHQAELQLKRDKRRSRQKKKEQDEFDRLNAPHICEVCGQTYTINDYMKSTGYKYRRNSGVCSAKCRDERKKQKAYAARAKRGSHNCKHYSRARKLGLPKDRGITLKNLVKRDGLTCAICGFPCYYYGTGKEDLYPSIDHIVPMHKGGGHTWDNVQIAHRICNSNKRDYVGEEWNNTEGGEQA